MSFEVVVRPFVSPVIRPSVPRVLPPDDEQGTAVLTGSNVALVNTSLSEQYSWTRSHRKEVERKVHRQKIYQKEPDGNINKDNYIEVETAEQIKVRLPEGGTEDYYYTKPPEADNIETIEIKTIKNPSESGSAAP